MSDNLRLDLTSLEHAETALHAASTEFVERLVPSFEFASVTGIAAVVHEFLAALALAIENLSTDAALRGQQAAQLRRSSAELDELLGRRLVDAERVGSSGTAAVQVEAVRAAVPVAASQAAAGG